MASEARLSVRLSGRQTPASGAIVGAKGDVVLPTFLLEAKSTTANSMVLKLDWLAKIHNEARSLSKEPALAVSFTTGDGKPVKNGAWVLMTEAMFKELTSGQA